MAERRRRPAPRPTPKDVTPVADAPTDDVTPVEPTPTVEASTEGKDAHTADSPPRANPSIRPGGNGLREAAVTHEGDGIRSVTGSDRSEAKGFDVQATPQKVEGADESNGFPEDYADQNVSLTESRTAALPIGDDLSSDEQGIVDSYVLDVAPVDPVEFYGAPEGVEDQNEVISESGQKRKFVAPQHRNTVLPGQDVDPYGRDERNEGYDIVSDAQLNHDDLGPVHDKSLRGALPKDSLTGVGAARWVNTKTFNHTPGTETDHASGLVPVEGLGGPEMLALIHKGYEDPTFRADEKVDPQVARTHGYSNADPAGANPDAVEGEPLDVVDRTVAAVSYSPDPAT